MQKSTKAENSLHAPSTSMMTCLSCDNTYIVIWLKQGANFNDFGDRHCPFCGLITEEFYFPIKE